MLTFIEDIQALQCTVVVDALFDDSRQGVKCTFLTHCGNMCSRNSINVAVFVASASGAIFDIAVFEAGNAKGH